ncbi:MAG: PadR family transcriptional regulator [Gemmatimonadetes bacterium]|nr:MAG: PadR family transcriptional regulator [Gemmatimonadota bacterium]
MGRGSGYLGEFEQMVLLAVLHLGEGAFAVEIARELEARAQRRVSRGALYSSLERLERKGYLEWRLEEATSARGGQPRRLFAATRAGVEALRAAHAAWRRMSEGLEDVLEPGAP